MIRLYFDGHIEQGRHVAEELLTRARSSESRALVARVQWDLGSLAFQQERFGASVENWQAALEAFESLGERNNIAVMHQSIAEAFGLLGNAPAAWLAHSRALKLRDTVDELRRRQAILTGPGYSALNNDMPEAAAHFFNEARSAAEESADPNYLFEAEVGEARAAAAAGDAERATRLMAVATALEARVTNPSYRARFGADLRLSSAEAALRRHEFDRVLALTSEILERVESVSSEYRLARVYALRGKARSAGGDYAGAQAEFERGVAHLESKRALLQQESLRISYMDTAWDLYADLVGVTALDRRQPSAALAWADRGRARALTELLTAGHQSRLTRAAIEGDAAVLFQVVSDRGVFSWLIRADGTAFKHANASSSWLSELATALDLPLTRRAEADRRLADGYDLLIRPFENQLQHVSRLIVVPDSTSQRVPFAALFDRTTRRFLAERVSIRVAPSLAVITSRHDLAPRSVRSVAVFVDPAVTTDLPRLRWARDEADAISALYSAGRVLTGPDASFAAVDQSLAEYDVVHIAVHAVADPLHRDMVKLLLADTPPAPDRHSSNSRSAIARVVSLAACQTGAGPVSRGEVLMNSARPFLMKRVPNVLVTSTDISDRDAHRVMTDFHRRLASGESPAEALAGAQRAAIAAGEPPTVWAVFVLISVE